jgi:putative tryptophan/tyrosine transport system substrate-binding protein
MRRTGRRRFLLAAGALAAAPLARGRTFGAAPRVGLLFPNPTRSSEGNAVDFFSGILKGYGWIPGENVELEYASGEGSEDRLPELAAALVEKHVDVIWAAGPEAAVAAARATRSIPVVFYGVAFPVEHGLVDSLAAPGRNVTGLASLAGAERSKGLETLLEIAPGLRRLAWLRVLTVARSVTGEEISIRTHSFESEAGCSASR